MYSFSTFYFYNNVTVRHSSDKFLVSTVPFIANGFPPPSRLVAPRAQREKHISRRGIHVVSYVLDGHTMAHILNLPAERGERS